MSTEPKHLGGIDVERTSSDMPAFEPGPAHTCPDALDNKVTFQFGDRPDDDDEGPPERASRVDVLAERDELDLGAVEFIENLQEM